MGVDPIAAAAVEEHRTDPEEGIVGFALEVGRNLVEVLVDTVAAGRRALACINKYSHPTAKCGLANMYTEAGGTACVA